ncbi:hypothetical protein P3X46_003230 [Hevea brasiliensis]|uniref:Uncharacterized protein n=1 Tax=Hevea brasiliensis TaxID=3981 RepID=A0ABQ9N7U1_HEVBR|nr:hypothetical protein P3X46_003230 [Hevea brasiliensis]
MASTRFFFSSSIFLLYLLVLTSAGDYGRVPNPDNSYASTPKLENVKPEDGYSPKPESEVVKPNDGCGPESKSDTKKPEDGYSPKPKCEVVKPDDGHGRKPDTRKPEDGYRPKPDSSTGVAARTICSAWDQNGYETTSFSCLTSATDAKGYFFRTLSLLGLARKISIESCNVSTDVDKGITGALFSSYRILHDKKIKLYSVGPFFYNPEPKPTPTGY